MSEEEKEYKGPGRFTAAVGRGIVESSVVGLAAAPFTARAVTKAFRDAETIEEGILKAHMSPVGLVAGAVELAALGHGVYKGWTNASHAKQDHADLVKKVDSFTERAELRHDVSEATRGGR